MTGPDCTCSSRGYGKKNAAAHISEDPELANWLRQQRALAAEEPLPASVEKVLKRLDLLHETRGSYASEHQGKSAA
jgi:hypothetical protein